MTFGPFGVGRHEGKAVMVPGAVAGDKLEVEIVSERRDYAVAKIRDIVSASAERRVGAVSVSAAMRRMRLAAYRLRRASAFQGRSRRARTGPCAGHRDRSSGTRRAGAGGVRLSIENPAQGRRQRRAWILRGRQQHDRRDRFVHGRRGGHPDAAAPGAIARQARRRDRGGARRRARSAGRASQEAGDRRGDPSRAQRDRIRQRDCGNRAAIGDASRDCRRCVDHVSSWNPGCRSTWTPIFSAR